MSSLIAIVKGRMEVESLCKVMLFGVRGGQEVIVVQGQVLRRDCQAVVKACGRVEVVKSKALVLGSGVLTVVEVERAIELYFLSRTFLLRQCLESLTTLCAVNRLLVGSSEGLVGGRIYREVVQFAGLVVAFYFLISRIINLFFHHLWALGSRL